MKLGLMPRGLVVQDEQDLTLRRPDTADLIGFRGSGRSEPEWNGEQQDEQDSAHGRLAVCVHW